MGQSTSVPNILLIILLVVIPVFVFVVSMVICCVYSSPMDTYQQIYHIVPKGIVLFTMMLIGLIPLLLPFDVANQTQNGRLDEVTPILWQILFSFIAIMVILVLPFCIIYYESQNSAAATGCQGILRQTMCGLLFTSIFAILVALVVGITYYWLGVAEIEVETVIQTEFQLDLAQSALVEVCTNCARGYSTMEPRMSIVLYVIAWLSLLGWVIFITAGGCGLSALPINCCMWAITTRVKRIDMNTYRECQKLLVDYSLNVIEAGTVINDTISKSAWVPSAGKMRQYKQWKEDAQLLEQDYKEVESAFKLGGTSIFKIIFYIIAGVCSAFISLIWVIHIFLWNIWLPPIFPALNSLFDVLETQVFPILAWIFYLFFVYYLLLCTLYGVIRIYSNIPFINFYPMRYRDTLLNGFLVNCGIMLLASITICQFSVITFSGYARYTSIDTMFRTFIGRMKYIRHVFDWIHYVFFAFIFIGVFGAVFELIWKKWIAKLFRRDKSSNTKTPHENIQLKLGKWA